MISESQTDRCLDHLKKVSLRPGMYMPRESYDCWVAYVHGYDAAFEMSLLVGLREWATMRFGRQANLEWSAALLGVITGDPWKDLQSEEENRDTVRRAFELISTFFHERGADLCATDILTRYRAWEQRGE